MGERRKTSVDRTDGKGRGPMSAAVIAVQAAAVAAMRAHAPLANAVSGVFDGPPPGVCFPDVTVGESPCVAWSHKSGRGREVDRKSVVEGKRVEVGVDLVGGRNIK